jgi:hypothetical protein
MTADVTEADDGPGGGGPVHGKRWCAVNPYSITSSSGAVVLVDQAAETVGVHDVPGRHADRSTRSSSGFATSRRSTPEEGVPFTSRGLVACLREGARRFGWAGRDPTPGARRMGRWLVGTGVAASTYPAYMRPTSAAARVDAESCVAWARSQPAGRLGAEAAIELPGWLGLGGHEVRPLPSVEPTGGGPAADVAGNLTAAESPATRQPSTPIGSIPARSGHRRGHPDSAGRAMEATSTIELAPARRRGRSGSGSPTASPPRHRTLRIGALPCHGSP